MRARPLDAAHWWRPYNAVYAKVDGLYGHAGYAAAKAGGDHWNAAQSYLNLFEVALTGVYLLLVNYNDAFSNIVGIVLSTATGAGTLGFQPQQSLLARWNSSHFCNQLPRGLGL